MRVAYSDHSSYPECGSESAKRVLHGPNSTESNLFHHGETTYRVWWLIWICYYRALERKPLLLFLLPILIHAYSFIIVTFLPHSNRETNENCEMKGTVPTFEMKASYIRHWQAWGFVTSYHPRRELRGPACECATYSNLRLQWHFADGFEFLQNLN